MKEAIADAIARVAKEIKQAHCLVIIEDLKQALTEQIKDMRVFFYTKLVVNLACWQLKYLIKDT